MIMRLLLRSSCVCRSLVFVRPISVTAGLHKSEETDVVLTDKMRDMGITDVKALNRLRERAQKFIANKPDRMPIIWEKLSQTYKSLMNEADDDNEKRAKAHILKSILSNKFVYKLALVALAVYIYTIYTVRKESFLDDLEPFPEPAPRKKATSLFAALKNS